MAIQCFNKYLVNNIDVYSQSTTIFASHCVIINFQLTKDSWENLKLKRARFPKYTDIHFVLHNEKGNAKS